MYGKFDATAHSRRHYYNLKDGSPRKSHHYNPPSLKNGLAESISKLGI